MARGRPANDNTGVAQASAAVFDYSAPAEMFLLQTRSPRGHSTSYRRFPTAAEAIRFAVEEVTAQLLVGAVMEVREERFDHKGIRELYQRTDYPLSRR